MLLLDWNIMIINSALHQLRKNEWPGFLILGMELCAIVHLLNYGNWQALSNFTSQRRRLFLYPVFSAYGKKVVPVQCTVYFPKAASVLRVVVLLWRYQMLY